MKRIYLRISLLAVVVCLVINNPAWAGRYDLYQAWEDGHRWGCALREGRALFHDFVHYLSWNITHTYPELQKRFYAGFVDGYGKNGEEVYSKAWNIIYHFENTINQPQTPQEGQTSP